MLEIFDLTGRVSIVTGATRGLGKAIALGLSGAGSKVVVTDVLDTTETVREIKEAGGEALGIRVDVSRIRDVEKMVKKTWEKWGRIDILVNNAGIFRDAAAEELKESDWRKVLDVNLTGSFLCAREAGKVMIRRRSGKIINISSVAGILAFSESAAYNASKAALILLTRTLAVEWGKYNIQVNAICPGVFATAMTEDFLKQKEFKDMIKRRVPLGRHAVPEELVGAVIFLASKASDYVTGHALVVDGGWTVGL